MAALECICSNLSSPLSYYVPAPVCSLHCLLNVQWCRSWALHRIKYVWSFQVWNVEPMQKCFNLPFVLEWPAGDNSAGLLVIEKLLPRCVLWFSVRCNQYLSSTLSAKYGYSIKPRWRQIQTWSYRVSVGDVTLGLSVHLLTMEFGLMTLEVNLLRAP